MSDEIIQLNVGGRLMTTTHSTLTKCKDSLLEKMFDKDSPFAPARRIDDAYFIDEDPDIFSAILTWLRHGVVDRKSLSTEHLMAAAAYFGLEDLRRSVGEAEAEEEHRRQREMEETENRRIELIEKNHESIKWTLEAVANNVKDLPNFLSSELLEFQVAMAIGALDGGTLTQICSHICTRQLSENSHTSPQDICTMVLFTLKKMREKNGPFRVAEDELGAWHFVATRRRNDRGLSTIMTHF